MPRSIRNRSGILVLSILSFLLVIAVWSRTGATAPLPPAEPSRDINTYVLFAFDELNFKGRDGNPSRGFIRGGNVGVNNPDPHGINHSPYGPVLAMGGGGSGHEVVMDDGSQVVADTVRIGETSSIWNLFANEVQNSFDPSVLRDPPRTPFTAPIINPANLPTCPPFSPGTLNVTVPKGGSLALAPGDYGDVRVQDNGTLTLGAGIYNLKSFNNGKKVRILTDPATDVRVAEDMSTNDGSFVGPADCARFCVRGDGVSHNDATVSFGRNTEIHGQFLAPNGQIRLGHTTDLFGRFWSKTISSDFNVNVTMACSVQTCITIISGNGNEGTRDSVVRFSTDGGTTFQDSFIIPPLVDPPFSYDVIAGTHYVSVTDVVAPIDEGAFDLFKVTFVLPAGFSSPMLSVQVHCDNAAELFLNGNDIGGQPDIENVTNFQNPPEVIATSNGSFFAVGANELTFRVHNFTNEIALDFKAQICYSTTLRRTAPGR